MCKLVIVLSKYNARRRRHQLTTHGQTTRSTKSQSLLQRLNIRGRLTTQNTGELRVTPEQGEYSDGATSYQKSELKA